MSQDPRVHKYRSAGSDRAGVHVSRQLPLACGVQSVLLSGSLRSRASPGGPILQDVPVESIEDCGLRIDTGRNWRGDQKMTEEVTIQTLEKNPTSICIDSGAGESVCPSEAFPGYKGYHTDKV